jgi:outer membrane receptor protein involved in Fe transport
MMLVALIVVLTGTVTAPDGSPIAGATVVADVPGAVAVTTAGDGTFALPGIALPVDLLVDAPGFSQRRVRVTADVVTVVLAPRAADVSVLVVAGAAPVGAVSLGQQELAAAPALTLDERLRVVPGLSLFRRSSARQANPTTHGVTMRGLSASGASRGLVLLDGVPLNDGFGAWVTWTRVPAMALERADVVTGASGDVFGSDALGGVIRLQGASVSGPGTSIAAEFGSADTRALDGAAGVARGRASVFAAGSAVISDGYVPIEPASAGAVDRRADLDYWNGYGRAEHAVGMSRFEVLAFGGTDDRGNGTALQRNRMSGGTAGLGWTHAGAPTRGPPRLSHSVNTFDQTFSAVAAGRASETLTSTQQIESDTTRATVEVSRSDRRGFAVARLGMSRASADFAESRAGVTTVQSLTDAGEQVSAQAGWSATSALTISAGSRLEWRAAPTADSTRDRATVGRAAVDWTPATHLHVRASAATSHRWPTLNELTRGFRVGNTQTLAHADLKPERARAVDLGVTWDNRIWRTTVTVFRTVVQDAIANVTQSSGSTIVRRRENAGDAVSQGVEASVEWRLRRLLRLTTAATIADATFQRSSEPAIDGRRLPQVPRVSLTASGWLTRGPLTGYVTVRTTGRQFDDDRNVFELAPATQVDASVSVQVGQVRVFVAGENVFDARIETGRTPLVSVAPGRAWRLGARWSLGDAGR